jgi:hypothetical protein
MSRQMKVALNLYTSATDPADGRLGEIYVNTTTTNIRVYNGASWIDLTPASDVPSLFYMHTHTYDGDVHTIDVENPVDFKEINTVASPEEDIPVIIGLDGGSPQDIVTDPLFSNLSLLDGGTIGN